MIKQLTAKILISFGFVFLFVYQASASCNPCICGPGGDFQGDLDQWWKKNCGVSSPDGLSTRSFIGHYKAVGHCKLIQGNRTMTRMEMKPVHPSAQLPEGSLVVTFQRYEDFDNDSFSTFVIPGSGTVKDPESSSRNPVLMSHFTQISRGLTSQNIHHERSGDRPEFFSLMPSALGGPIWDLLYTTGEYETKDKCQFVKID